MTSIHIMNYFIANTYGMIEFRVNLLDYEAYPAYGSSYFTSRGLANLRFLLDNGWLIGPCHSFSFPNPMCADINNAFLNFVRDLWENRRLG